MYAAYIRGKLALAGIDLSTDLGVWLDAVYAVWADAPHKHLESAQAELVKASARLRPEEARATWGLDPAHQRMAGTLGKGPGLEAGRRAGMPPPANSRLPRPR